MHRGDLAGGFSDLEMTWLLYCAGTATVSLHCIITLHCIVFNVLSSVCVVEEGHVLLKRNLNNKYMNCLISTPDNKGFLGFPLVGTKNVRVCLNFRVRGKPALIH